MKKLVILLLILTASLALLAQQPGDEVVVTDFAELYSTYEISKQEKAEITNQVDDELLDEIKEFSTEENWPKGIATLDKRNANRDKMYEYALRYVCTIGDKIIITATVEDNEGIEGPMALTHDIYFIVGKKFVREPDEEE